MSGSAGFFTKKIKNFYLVGSPKVGGAGDGKHKKKYGHPYTIMRSSSEYTKKTRSYIITYTGHYRRLYKRYRSRPTTLYTSYTIMRSSSEYTKNTRSCIVTYTDHDR